MIELHALTQLNGAQAAFVTGSYTCTHTYRIAYNDTAEQTSITLERVALPKAVTRKYGDFDEETLQRYRAAFAEGYSWGAFDGDQLVGMLIAEARHWNQSLWVWEFHVAEVYRGQGIGRSLMERAVERAQAAGLRIVVCETQNRNATAIEIYRRLGFRIEGIDISYYTNHDYPDHDVAVFMKRRLDEPQ